MQLSGENQTPTPGSPLGEKSARGRLVAPALAALTCALAFWTLTPAPHAGEITDHVTGVRIADNAPRLPPPTPQVGSVHRRADGQIELVDPATTGGTSARLCAVNTLCVGAGQAYATLSAALAFAREYDVIEIAGGSYRESATVAVHNLTIRGVNGQPHFDCAGVVLQADKACLLLAADGVTLENLDISGAQISDNAGANGACIRNEPNMSFTLRDIVCHASQSGVLSEGGSILVENSDFFDNGWNEFAHNVYFGGNCSVTVRGSIFRDARVGHEFKSRCFKTTISDSTFRSTKGSRNLDIANGGETSLYRSILIKTSGTDNSGLIGFASESCTHPGDMLVKEVRIINSDPAGEIHNYDRCAGRAIILDAVTFEGIRPKTLGYIKEATEIPDIAAAPAATPTVVPLSQP
jgi:hypothetical protein